MAAETPGRDVHLVGSFPLADAAEVFRTANAILGERLKRISDGETDPRANWIAYQYACLTSAPMGQTEVIS